MSNINSNVHIISKNFAHHSRHSGYDRLLDFIPNTPLPGPHLSSMFNQAYKQQKITTCPAQVDGYGIDEINNELNIMWHICFFKRQIFHFIYGENCFCYSTAKNRKNKVFLATYHQPETWFSMHGKERYKYFTSKIELLDGVIAVSSDQADFFRQFNRNVFCVHHGIDTDFFSPPTSTLRDPNLCLFVGNWLRDFETLKECSRIMKLRNPNVKIQAVTPEKNRPLLDGADLEVFSGIDDAALREKYRTASVALLPLKDCTANNSALEAMACGLPIVVSDVGGIRDYATDDFAIFCEQGNAEQMVDSVLKIIGDLDLQSRMGNLARERAKALFAWPIIGQKMTEVYQGFLSQ